MNLRLLFFVDRLVGVFFFLIFFGVVPIVALAQGGIDEVLNRAETKQAVRNSLGVDSSVYEGISSALQEAQKKAEKIDRANSEFRSVGSGSNTGSKYSCSVTCTGSWWASGSNVMVSVLGGTEDQAKEVAAKEADPLCRGQKTSSGVFRDVRLSAGSAKCQRVS